MRGRVHSCCTYSRSTFIFLSRVLRYYFTHATDYFKRTKGDHRCALCCMCIYVYIYKNSLNDNFKVEVTKEEVV